MSVEGKSTALAFLSITVVLCRSRGESAALVRMSIFVALCGERGGRGFGDFVDICRIVSVEVE